MRNASTARITQQSNRPYLKWSPLVDRKKFQRLSNMSKKKTSARFHGKTDKDKYATSSDSRRSIDTTKGDHEILEQHVQYFEIAEGPSKYYDLSLCLAQALDPATQKRGRKGKWSPLRKLQVVSLVEKKIDPKDPAKGITWACRQVANKEPFPSDSADVLRKVYHDTIRMIRAASLEKSLLKGDRQKKGAS